MRTTFPDQQEQSLRPLLPSVNPEVHPTTALSLSVLIQFMCAGTASHGYVNVESSAPDPDAENYR